MGEAALSIVAGPPLDQEAGQGAHTIGGYLREIASRYGPREALVLRKGAHRLAWSYADLLDRSLDVARALVASGMGKDSRVGILMTNRPEFLSSLFGVALAGGVPVALSTFSTPSELDHLVKASQASLILFEQHVLKKDFHAMLTGLEPAIAAAAPGALVSERYPYLRHLVSLGGVPGDADPLESRAGGAVEHWASFLARGAQVPDALVLARADGVHPTDTGGIFFSSGTTSLPKGIVHSQRAFAIQWWRWPRVFAMKQPVRSWTGNGFFWSGNISMVVGTAFSTGGAVILQRYFDAEEALFLAEAEKVSFLNGRPHQWARLQAAPNWASADLSSLRYIPRGELIWQHPTVRTDWQVPMSFGCTETMTICTSFTADTEQALYEGSFGAPLPGNTLKIVEPISGRVLPRGQIGEMCIKGPTLMSGYLGKAPEECFDAEGYYCSGDGGYVDAQGRFFWEGRLTDMIKTGGANVAPIEVDDVIARIPGVKRTQTVGVPDDLLGEMVVACIVPVDGATLAEADVIAHCKAEIASFKVPRRVLFFTDEDYAITGSEKVKSAQVRELAVRRLDRENAATG
ncbi:class I adenylate-forming enzyme family protein [Novosphingobium album (ex Liu et al. 2023)]|uniref:Class I adenylate-forming enzyme family protein n=1 Tax=Novosphingobium album (ex Liu et al. 2023) TaxID=3031130 RepID=A0ABT5WUC3_9SPHN|nr:class I adenylate-forming enzyme family protein [Novosphingobium album (ex Liu et al. 2023)]MDE8653505.1 class I adenylate-forming enzyme family protein [Novosphingobium album (ex Liu et al. 2023)]